MVLLSLITNVGIVMIDFNRSKSGSNVIQFVIDLEKPVPTSFIERWVTPFVSLEFDETGTRKRSADIIIDEIRNELGLT